MLFIDIIMHCLRIEVVIQVDILLILQCRIPVSYSASQ